LKQKIKSVVSGFAVKAWTFPISGWIAKVSAHCSCGENSLLGYSWRKVAQNFDFCHKVELFHSDLHSLPINFLQVHATLVCLLFLAFSRSLIIDTEEWRWPLE
jgi:hypothetical protein